MLYLKLNQFRKYNINLNIILYITDPISVYTVAKIYYFILTMFIYKTNRKHLLLVMVHFYFDIKII